MTMREHQWSLSTNGRIQINGKTENDERFNYMCCLSMHHDTRLVSRVKSKVTSSKQTSCLSAVRSSQCHSRQQLCYSGLAYQQPGGEVGRR